MDAKAGFNKNRRDIFANSNSGCKDSWNDYISLAKAKVVDFSPIFSALSYMYDF